MAVVSLGKRIIPDPYKPVVARRYHSLRISLDHTKANAKAWFVDRLILPNAVGRFLLYRVFSNSFDREHKAVAAGRLAFLKERRQDTRSLYLLRRNIHRIEKGLVSENPRKVFALDYIEETLEEFRALSQTVPMTTEYTWARDVLETYFRTVSHSDPRISRTYEEFRAICPAEQNVPTENRPYLRDIDTDPIEIGALKNLSLRRRSVRSYLPKPVPRTQVDKAIDVARFSPSACNRQAFTFRIFDTPNTARKVASLPMGTTSFIDNINAVVVVVGHLRAYPYARDRHAVYIDASLAAMSFVYGLEAQGIASCVINWADESKRERAAAKMLHLKPDERVLMMISYGWPNPDVPVPFSAKRPIHDMRIFEESP